MQFSVQYVNMLQDALELGTITNMQTVLSIVALNTSIKRVFKYCNPTHCFIYK